MFWHFDWFFELGASEASLGLNRSVRTNISLSLSLSLTHWFLNLLNYLIPLSLTLSLYPLYSLNFLNDIFVSIVIVRNYFDNCQFDPLPGVRVSLPPKSPIDHLVPYSCPLCRTGNTRDLHSFRLTDIAVRKLWRLSEISTKVYIYLQIWMYLFESGIDLQGVTEGLVTFRLFQIWPILGTFRQKSAKIMKNQRFDRKNGKFSKFLIFGPPLFLGGHTPNRSLAWI